VKSGKMPTVPEADIEEESDYRKTLENSKRKTLNFSSEGEDDEIHLQDLFFENSIFKYIYFQDEEFTKNIPKEEIYQQLATVNFKRAKNPNQENRHLLKSSLD